MTFKRFGSLALSSALALSLSVPAFAADVTDISEATEVEITGKVNVPTIALTVPTSGEVILNPYNLEYEIATGVKADDSIVTAPMHIVNGTKAGISIEYTVTASSDGVAKLTANTPSTTDKEVQLKFAIEAVADNQVTSFTSATETVVDPENGAKSTTAVELAAADAGSGNKAALFGFTGETTSDPDEAWTSDDTINATIAFTFKPVANTPAGSGSGSGSGSGTP